MRSSNNQKVQIRLTLSGKKKKLKKRKRNPGLRSAYGSQCRQKETADDVWATMSWSHLADYTVQSCVASNWSIGLVEKVAKRPEKKRCKAEEKVDLPGRGDVKDFIVL